MRTLLTTALILVFSAGLWLASEVWGGDARPRSGQVQSPGETSLKLTNRVWRNNASGRGREVAVQLVLLDRAKVRAGVVAHLSEWRVHIDRVRYRLEGRRLVIESPQEGTRTAYDVRTWRCPGEAPAPFDLCLELTRGGHRTVLYSEQRSHFTHDMDARVRDALRLDPGL